MIRESWLVRAMRLQAEHEAKETVEEALHKRIRWEDWATLLPELVGFARSEIRRRRWRGGRSTRLRAGRGGIRERTRGTWEDSGPGAGAQGRGSALSVAA